MPNASSCTYTDPLAPNSLAICNKLSFVSAGNPFFAGPIIKAISSISSSITEEISSTNLCTIGLPAITVKGLGTVKVCGLKRDPIPAIGTIIFIFFFFKIKEAIYY